MKELLVILTELESNQFCLAPGLVTTQSSRLPQQGLEDSPTKKKSKAKPSIQSGGGGRGVRSLLKQNNFMDYK